MKSLEFAEKEAVEEKETETKKNTKSFEELLNEVELESNYNYDDVSLSLISDILIEIKRMLSKKHNQMLSASRISRDLNDLLLLLCDTSCTKKDFDNIKELLVSIHSLLVSYLDNRNDEDLKQMIDVVLQLKDKNKILVDNTKELSKTPAGQAFLGYYGRNAELLSIQAKTNKLIRGIIAKEIKEKYPSLDLYDYSELDEAYKKLYNAIKNDDAEAITNTRGELIKKLKKHNSDIKKHSQDLKTIIDIYKVIDINSIDLNTKINRIKEIVKKEKNPEIRKMIEDNLDNFREFKKEFYELYNLLEVKKTELYKDALKEELKAHGEFLKRRYNNEVLSKRFNIITTIPKGISYSIRKLANSVDRLKYNEYKRKTKSLLKEAVIDATRVVSVPGVSALKFGAENWYTIYLVSNGLITINNERKEAAESYKELNPGVSDEEALKHVDDAVKDTPYRAQTVDYKNKVRVLALEKENAINTYMRTHPGVSREQAEETVENNSATTSYNEQASNYENEYNTNRSEAEARDRDAAIKGYMKAYGVSEEEAIEAVERNSNRASYETQARTYEDMARNNAQGNDNPTPEPDISNRSEAEARDREDAIKGYMKAYGVSEEEAIEAVEENSHKASYETQARTYEDMARNKTTGDEPQENQPENPEGTPEINEPAPVEEVENPIEEKIEAIDTLNNSLGNCTTLENKETGEKIVIVFADDGKYYSMRYDKDNNPIDVAPVPITNLEEIRNNENYVLSEDMIDIYDLPDIPNETIIKNLDVGGKITYTYGEDNNQTVNIIRLDDDRFFVETIDNSNGQTVSEETISLKDTPDYFAEFDEEFNEELGKLYTLQPSYPEQATPEEMTNLGVHNDQAVEEPENEEQNAAVPNYVNDPNLEHLNYEAARTKAMNQLTNMSSGDTVVVEYFENEETHTMIVYKIEDAYYVLDAKDIVDVDQLYEQELRNAPEGNIPYRQTWENANSPDRLRDKFMRLDSLDDLHGCTLSDEEIRIPQAPTSFYLGELEVGETVTFKRDDGTFVDYKMGKDGRIYYSEHKDGESPVNPALVINNNYADDNHHMSYAYSNQEDMEIGMDNLIDMFNSLEPGQSITLGFTEDVANTLTVVTRTSTGFQLTINYGKDTQEYRTYETAAELAEDGLDKVVPQVLTDQYGNMPNGIGTYIDIPIWLRPDFYNAAPVTNLRVYMIDGHIVGVSPMNPMQESALDLIMNGENPIQVGFK